jgi:peptidoglycan/xylan/chitin deacetylase (PgdA/CDA1 family)
VTIDRRTFLLRLGATGVAAGVLAACGASEGTGSPDASDGATAPAGGAGDPTSSPDGGDATTTTAVDTTGTWIVRGPTDTDQVALTFHTDGPTSMVTAVLDLVEARGLVITAFIVGSWLEANPAMGARLVDGGHEIANHTTTHPTFESLTPAQMTTEIEGCRTVLDEDTGTPGRWFRPSGTDNGIDSPSAATLAAAGAAGYTVIGYDVDPLDYKDPGSKAVIDRTLAATVGGSIISLHMGHQGTIDAMPAMLDGLEAKGLRPVSVSTLLG